MTQPLCPNAFFGFIIAPLRGVQVFHAVEKSLSRMGGIFHTMEKFTRNGSVFSTQWKKFQRFFHTMEQL
jgi:hypothetical protein